MVKSNLNGAGSILGGRNPLVGRFKKADIGGANTSVIDRNTKQNNYEVKERFVLGLASARLQPAGVVDIYYGQTISPLCKVNLFISVYLQTRIILHQNVLPPDGPLNMLAIDALLPDCPSDRFNLKFFGYCSIGVIVSGPFL